MEVRKDKYIKIGTRSKDNQGSRIIKYQIGYLETDERYSN